MDLRVDSSGPFLLRYGMPWFLLGDTSWELLHRLDLQETAHYLRTRAGQGFNTVLTVAIAEFDGLTRPNADGDLPFDALDPARSNEPYWRHVDAVVRLDLPAGRWSAREFDPVTGEWSAAVAQEGGRVAVPVRSGHDAVLVLEQCSS